MNSITQDLKYRYSLMKYTEKYGVSRVSRKYSKARYYIYFCQKRFNGNIGEALACQSRRPHSHPNQHNKQELKLIRYLRHHNLQLSVVELWLQMRKRGYTHCVESLWRKGLAVKAEPQKPYKPKPYEQTQSATVFKLM